MVANEKAAAQVHKVTATPPRPPTHSTTARTP
jgi:hypothetical protein